MSTVTYSGRPRSLVEMAERQMKNMAAAELAASIASYKPRATDIIITPYAKCGTTWLQQTFHTLRTRGDMDFDDISRVVPWIETAGPLGLDLEAPQRAEPRGFKSHLPYDQIPKGARYVVSLRDPKDATVSRYRFMEGWWLEPGSVSLAEWVESSLGQLGRGRDYWHHLLSFWEQRDNPDVLIFSYEHMSAEPVLHIRRLAEFCGIELDDALLALTLERSSLAYMLKYKDRFDDAMMRTLSETKAGLPKGGDSAKVRSGKVGSHKTEMTAETASSLDRVWAEAVEPKTGFRTYAALEAAVRERVIGRAH